MLCAIYRKVDEEKFVEKETDEFCESDMILSNFKNYFHLFLPRKSWNFRCTKARKSNQFRVVLLHGSLRRGQRRRRQQQHFHLM